jgi:hypothetical protein
MVVTFLRANSDMFTWTPSDMPGVPREVIEHHLAMCPQAHPMKLKTKKQAQEKEDFIVQEIEKLKKAKLIREVAHPTWIANLVVVPKADGSWAPLRGLHKS